MMKNNISAMDKAKAIINNLNNSIIISELLLITPAFGLTELILVGKGELNIFAYICLIILCVMTIIKELYDILKALINRKIIMQNIQQMNNMREEEKETW